MFRKLFLLAAFVLTAGIAAQAQNVQVHYDFGRAMYSEQNVGDVKVIYNFVRVSTSTRVKK